MLVFPATSRAVPSVIQPAPGSTVNTGYVGPIIVSSDEEGSYTVAVTGDGYALSRSVYLDTFENVEIAIDPLHAEGTYTIQITSQVTGQVVSQSTFAAIAPALEFSSLSVSPRDFYPIVIDRYRDVLNVSGTLTKVGSVEIRVMNSKRRVIRSATFVDQDSFVWAWNGRNRAGSKVPQGFYYVQITGRSGDEAITSDRIRVTVKTAVITKRGSKTRSAPSANYADGDPGCTIEDSYIPGMVNMSCLLGYYTDSVAVLGYRFSVPQSAFGLSTSVTYDDYLTTGFVSYPRRPAKTLVIAWVSVTHPDTLEFSSITISYRYRVRI